MRKSLCNRSKKFYFFLIIFLQQKKETRNHYQERISQFQSTKRSNSITLKRNLKSNFFILKTKKRLVKWLFTINEVQSSDYNKMDDPLTLA